MREFAYSVELKPDCRYFKWEEELRVNMMVRVREFDSLGTFHVWNTDHLLTII